MQLADEHLDARAMQQERWNSWADSRVQILIYSAVEGRKVASKPQKA